MPRRHTFRLKRRFAGHRDLMQRRIYDVLLVASPYDRFIFEEDGQFAEAFQSQYAELSMSAAPPRITQVSTGEQARALLEHSPRDLVITTPHCTDMSPIQLTEELRQVQPEIPVVMLTHDRVMAQSYADLGLDASGFDEVFLWGGDPRLLLVMLKLVEDRLNLEYDTHKGGVRVILVVEDTPVFYSSYLPSIYTEVLAQVQASLGEVLDQAGRLHRRRARPKVLLARTFEGAVRLIEKYDEYLLGLITDNSFPRGEDVDAGAGPALIEYVRRTRPHLPILLQSAGSETAPVARALGVSFADKSSPDLLALLRRFIREQLGFGPFVFRLRDGTQVDNAANLQQLLRALIRIPDESLALHGGRNDISKWLMTRCEFDLASEFRSWRLEDFDSIAAARDAVTSALSEYLSKRMRGLVTDYVRGTPMLSLDFTRLGRGSMGGKARGIAFCNAMLAHHPIHDRFRDVRIFVPRAKVICTGEFERFISQGSLVERAVAAESDPDVARLFLQQPLDGELLEDLRAILSEVHYPLAVRSSSLAEDSAFEPLAGVYETLFVPNCSASDAIRLDQLSRAIKLVFASVFYRGPQSYREAGQLRLEEEMMAVVIQRLVGNRYGDRFYPDFAGVAQSHNFYPIRYMTPEDGVVTVALGLGSTVVDGGVALRFCPRYPELMPQMSSPELALQYSQREFRALDLSDPDVPIGPNQRFKSNAYDLSAAEADGTLAAIGATYVAANDRIVDTIHQPGARIVNFSGVLKYDRFPLADIVAELLEIGQKGLGTPVEMEFAVALQGVERRPEFALLQLRPLVSQPVSEEDELHRLRPDEMLVMSGPALGAGVISNLCDVIYVHPESFQPQNTPRMAQVIGRLNAELVAAGRPYMLIGPGRWGTADHYLGIPVSWPQVAGARVVVELAIPGYRIDPSQGSHFFHHITSLRIGYFTVDTTLGTNTFDAAWFESRPTLKVDQGVHHLRLAQPLEVHINAREGRGMAFSRTEVDP